MSWSHRVRNQLPNKKNWLPLSQAYCLAVIPMKTQYKSDRIILIIIMNVHALSYFCGIHATWCSETSADYLIIDSGHFFCDCFLRPPLILWSHRHFHVDTCHRYFSLFQQVVKHCGQIAHLHVGSAICAMNQVKKLHCVVVILDTVAIPENIVIILWQQ